MAVRMTSRERVKTAIARKVPDRVPIQDGPWGATIERWRNEGLPKDKGPAEYFGYEIRAIGADLSPRLPTKELERNEEYVTTTNSWGGKRRNHLDYSTTPEVIECPVKTRDDWLKLKGLLEPDFTRVDWVTSRNNYERWRDEGLYIVFSGASGYDLMQSVMKSENLLFAMAQDPEWIAEMIATNADLLIRTADLMWEKGFAFDALWAYNDMGYRNSSLFSPKMYREIIMPSDRRICDFAHSRGMQTILHSCGCVKPLIPSLIEAGFDCLQPLEVKAGMDVGELKKLHGSRLALFGGINVMCMEDPDPGEIEEEIRTKFAAGMSGGGYLYHSDHSIPKDVSFDRYCYVMDLVKKYGAYN